MKTASTIRKILNKASESLVVWLSGALISALAAVFLVTESSLLNWRFKLREVIRQPQQADSSLAVIALFTKLARDPSVTPREYLARLIRKASQYQPAVIALDYELLEEDRRDPYFDSLKAAIAEAGNVVLPCTLFRLGGKYEILAMPPRELTANACIGYATLFDETVYDMIVKTQLANTRVLPSFALAIVAGYRFPEKFFPQRRASAFVGSAKGSASNGPFFKTTDWDGVLQSLHYPASGEERQPINYFGPADREHTQFFYRADDFLTTTFRSNPFKNKIMLIGSTYPLADGRDEFNTPFGKMQGVEVHANIINNLLKGKGHYLARLGIGWTVLLSVIALAIAVLSLLKLRLTAAAAVTTTYLLVYIIAGFILFSTHNLILPLAWPFKTAFFGFLLFYYLQQHGPLKRKLREFLDFEILLEDAGKPQRYRLRLIDAPAQAGDGKAEVIIAKNDEFEKSLKRLQRNFVDKDFLQDFGHDLFQRLFVGEIAADYQSSLTQARIEKKGLRVRLRIDAPELRVLPWEYLYDKRHHSFLAANSEILLTRYVESNQPKRDLQVEELQVLIVLSQPAPETLLPLGLPELDVRYEKELIVAALDELRDNTDIPIHYTILEHAVDDEIRQHLRQECHVFHFIGHSTYRDGIGKIVLENAEHEAVLFDEEKFSNMFLGHSDMRLVILNSCKSAATSALPQVSGLAYQIIARGVPAVVAMQYAIDDDAAIKFSREFYRTLAGGHPVDFATAHARLALAQNNDRRDFGIPVLFMRAREGRIV
jgi:CHASE2 domain-containing sensor protein/CHAT domain-containing protein